MAVEIRELVIKAIITEGTKAKKDNEAQVSDLDGKDAIIQECVNQVMKIIKKNQSR